MTASTRDDEVLARVEERLEVRITRATRVSRQRRTVGVLVGLGVVAAGVAAGITTFEAATSRTVRDGAACYATADLNEPDLAVAIMVEGLPDEITQRVALATSMCGSDESVSAVCVRPDGLAAVFPTARDEPDAEWCARLGLDALESR
ncbi:MULTISPECIES: hypothetical protein [unclassified Rathayibacter]|uniref:hypothetical protein n=1 Tax=unclassified Rathayibacter TaxID=2609250 RepID=UPI00104F559B|nr:MULTISPECIES: hypothetical protein [unclassified Rathayibacter]MCJ1705934.1 hypothetical protein [Rathayibacter sp. VKM Ac-2926]TCL86048.1 hypothetical protein EDF49_101717 [Rathayibacter sp. PhB192]TCM31869.1 hypothetical protein EDF43_101717 [Rathayibacter sp. PhB179]